jgi:predicted dehydrogenase
VEPAEITMPIAGSPLKVLLIGCGNIAGGFDSRRSADMPPLTHAGAFREHGGFALSACVDPDTPKREAFMARWGISLGGADLPDLDAQAGAFDVVSICSTTALHAQHLEAALALRPQLVFCEKPITPTVEETQRLVISYERVNTLLAVNHTRRWAPDVARLRQELQQGKWGTVRSVTGRYNKGILNNGTHLVDLIQFLCGPLELLSAGRPVADYCEDDPTLPALLETGAGVPVQLVVGDARDYALFELEIVTSQATLSMQDGGMRWCVRRVADSAHFAGYKSLSEPTFAAGEYVESMRNAVANVNDAVRKRSPLASTGATALAAQRICDQIRKAALPIKP